MHVLLVEDNPGDAALIEARLAEAEPQVRVTHVERLAAAEQLLREHHVDVVLVDLGLPDSQGLQSARRVREAAPDVPVVVLTGLDDEDLAIQAVRAGAQDFLRKGRVNTERLLHALHYAVERQRLLERVDAASAQARASAANLRNVLRMNVDGIVVVSTEGTVLYANPAAEEIFGLTPEQFAGRRFGSLPRPGETMQLEVTGRYGLPRLVEIRAVQAEWEGGPAVLASMRDLSERAQAEQKLRHREEQLREAQKLEAVGLLAGGVAHDFNNLLTVILGRCQLALRQDEAVDDRSAEDFHLIEASAERGAALTRQLLAFARREVLQPRVLDLNAVVTDMEPILRAVLGSRVRLVWRPEPALGKVLVDRSHLEQVILNLVVNARDAMPRGGTLAITTRNAVLDDAWCRDHVGAKPGPHAALSVSDTGVGMDEATRSRVFEPFFTTKGIGKGTGLGLATSYGIVQQSGGTIWAASEVGSGSTFDVYLPLTAEPDATPAPPPPAAPPAPRHGAVLLVEDDAQVRAVTHKALELAGFEVVSVEDAGLALQVLEQRAADFHVVVTDVVMPGMSGVELAERVARDHTTLRILLMSGYTGDESVLGHVRASGFPFLQKPFRLEDLVRQVRALVA